MDFTELKTTGKAYAGANGKKICVLIDGVRYMLKFPAPAPKNPELSYANSSVTEYLGCHVFERAGIDVQHTILGTYTFADGTQKLAVACRDFTSPGILLQDFASMKNQVVESSREGKGTELGEVLATIDEQGRVDRTALRRRFWDMFVVDALIGNWDRHNGNWGFLYNEFDDSTALAPVFDCGSALMPQADASLMRRVLDSKYELEARVFDRPLSALRIADKKINYHPFIASLEYEGCNEALLRIVPRLDLGALYEVVGQTPYLDALQRRFYEVILEARYVEILRKPYERLMTG